MGSHDAAPVSASSSASSGSSAAADAAGWRRSAARKGGATEDPGASRALRLLREAGLILGALVVLALAAFLVTYHRADPGFSHVSAATVVHNAGGRMGAWIADLLLLVFGLSAWIWVTAGAAWVVRGFRRLHAPYADEGLPDWAQALGLVLLIASATALEALRLQGLASVLPGPRAGSSAA